MFAWARVPEWKAQSVIADAAQMAEDKIGAVIERANEIITKET